MSRGFGNPLPIAPRGKVPWRPGEPGPLKAWASYRLGVTELAEDFNDPTMNIGVLLGDGNRVDGQGYALIDVDLDCDEAVALGSDYLPETLTSGRASRPRSHWWYFVDNAPPKANYQLRDPLTRKVIAELRSTGGQTVVPWSVHTSGELVRWYDDREIAHTDPRDVMRRLLALGRAVVAARHGADAANTWRPFRAPVSKSESRTPATEAFDPTLQEKRALAWVATLPPSEGPRKRGHGCWRRLFAAAAACVKNFELGDDAALRVLQTAFNPRCTTGHGGTNLWPTSELRRAIACARKHSDFQRTEHKQESEVAR